MMSIEMAGLVYCPLSPQDPEYRLHGLVEQTESHLILVHYMTKDKFNDNHVTLDIDTVINTDYMLNEVGRYRLSNIDITSESIAYVIFTSGSTGTPKAVSISLCIATANGAPVCSRLGSSATSKYH
jgi:non-ribosomal peptide synthetase component F